jgi:hypothetical protein
VKPGVYRIEVRVSGTPLRLTRWTYLAPRENVSAVAYLTDSGRLTDPSGKPSPRLGIFANDVSSPGGGRARVIVRHLADAPAVDVLAGGNALIDALANPGFAAAVVPAGTYRIQVVADADIEVAGCRSFRRGGPIPRDRRQARREHAPLRGTSSNRA